MVLWLFVAFAACLSCLVVGRSVGWMGGLVFSSLPFLVLSTVSCAFLLSQNFLFFIVIVIVS